MVGGVLVSMAHVAESDHPTPSRLSNLDRHSMIFPESSGRPGGFRRSQDSFPLAAPVVFRVHFGLQQGTMVQMTLKQKRNLQGEPSPCRGRWSVQDITCCCPNGPLRPRKLGTFGSTGRARDQEKNKNWLNKTLNNVNGPKRAEGRAIFH